MRIIGGELKGKRLHPVRGIKIRPTADRLRESIFNILAFQVRNTRVLDLFAGTGSLGIEALSRGAESAVFIDNNSVPISLIHRNIQSCGLGARTKIIQWNILKNLNCLKSIKSEFNMVFMDPPYGKNTIQPSLVNLYRSESLAPGAMVVVEHTAMEPLPDDLPAFRIEDQRMYGKTLVSFINHVV